MLQIGRASCREGVWIAEGGGAGSRRHTRFDCDWSSDVCSSDLAEADVAVAAGAAVAGAALTGAGSEADVAVPAGVALTGAESAAEELEPGESPAGAALTEADAADRKSVV